MLYFRCNFFYRFVGLLLDLVVFADENCPIDFEPISLLFIFICNLPTSYGILIKTIFNFFFNSLKNNYKEKKLVRYTAHFYLKYLKSF